VAVARVVIDLDPRLVVRSLQSRTSRVGLNPDRQRHERDRSPIRPAEVQLIAAANDRVAILVKKAMMPPAQEHEVLEIG
jgi:hypothetical protein